MSDQPVTDAEIEAWKCQAKVWWLCSADGEGRFPGFVAMRDAAVALMRRAQQPASSALVEAVRDLLAEVRSLVKGGTTYPPLIDHFERLESLIAAERSRTPDDPTESTSAPSYMALRKELDDRDAAIAELREEIEVLRIDLDGTNGDVVERDAMIAELRERAEKAEAERLRAIDPDAKLRRLLEEFRSDATKPPAPGQVNTNDAPLHAWLRRYAEHAPLDAVQRAVAELCRRELARRPQ